jgi:hypothetical protein
VILLQQRNQAVRITVVRITIVRITVVRITVRDGFTGSCVAFFIEFECFIYKLVEVGWNYNRRANGSHRVICEGILLIV